jgi:Peptidase family M28
MKDLLSRLIALPHRAVGSIYEAKTFDIIADYVQNDNISLEKQAFSSPPHFMATIWWALGGMTMGLFLAPVYPLFGTFLTLTAVVSIYVFFDWHPVWLSKLPPQVKTHNFIGKKQTVLASDGVATDGSKKKLIFMAHWDTVPISIMYHPKLLQGFEKSLWSNLVVMFLTVLCCGAFSLDFTPNWLGILRGGLLFYLLFQMFWIGMDFWRLGYSNGANDNGTGVVAAVEVARYFWQNPIPNLDVELLLIGAEEVGLIGAFHYYKNANLTNTTLINFDNVGFDNVFIIKDTKTFSTIDYTQFDIYKMARKVAETQAKFNGIVERPFRTTNVDSAPFARHGIPCLTITSVDNTGLPTYIHRPEDTMSNVNLDSVQLTVDYTIEIVKEFYK